MGEPTELADLGHGSERLVSGDALRRSLRLLKELEASIGTRFGPQSPGLPVRQLYTTARDGSPESERAIELAREATAVMITGDDALRSRVLTEVASEISNNVMLVGHYVIEAAHLASSLAELAAFYGPDEVEPMEALRGVIAATDEARRRPA